MSAMKEARKKSGLTQTQAAQASGIPLGTLRRWEQGVNQPDIDSMILLADLYGVSVDELLGSKFYTTKNNTCMCDRAHVCVYLRLHNFTHGRARRNTATWDAAGTRIRHKKAAPMRGGGSPLGRSVRGPDCRATALGRSPWEPLGGS